MRSVNIYTDGACKGNPGAGGYGVILEYNGKRKELSEGFADTTNNRMEITAAIVGLSALKEPCRVTLYSDSKYLTDAVNKRWVYAWKKNNWVKSDKKKALNIDLWEKLLALLELHEVTFIWVKGHDGHPENERCDELASAAAERAAK